MNQLHPDEFEVLFFQCPGYQFEGALDELMLLAGMLNSDFLVLWRKIQIRFRDLVWKMGNQYK